MVRQKNNPSVEVRLFTEQDDPRIFIRYFKTLMMDHTDESKATQFMNAMCSLAIDKMKGDLNKEWVYSELKELFLNSLVDHQEQHHHKDKFASIKVKSGETLTEFGERFNEQAQHIRYNGNLDLVDIKNAMSQAV